MASYDQLLNSLAQSQAMATSANLKRYDQAMKIYDTIIENYSPGGAFEKSTLSQLSKQKKTDVGQEQQQLISGGLYGTTTAAATGRRWEESVGAPARLKLEDLQMQRLSEAQLGKAGFIERREDVGPDYSMLANLAQMGAGSGGSTGGTSYGFGADASNRPGWGLGTYGTLGGTSGGSSSTSNTGPIHGTSKRSPGSYYKRPSISASPQSSTGTSSTNTSSTDNSSDIMSAAYQNYYQDVKSSNPSSNLGFLNLEYYKDLLSKTPKNSSRGVWKAYKQAGGTV